MVEISRSSIVVALHVRQDFIARVNGYILTADQLAAMPVSGIEHLIETGFIRDMGQRSSKSRPTRYDELLAGTATHRPDPKVAKRERALGRAKMDVAKERVLAFCVETGRRRPKPAELKRAAEGLLAGPRGDDIVAEAVARVSGSFAAGAALEPSILRAPQAADNSASIASEGDSEAQSVARDSEDVGPLREI